MAVPSVGKAVVLYSDLGQTAERFSTSHAAVCIDALACALAKVAMPPCSSQTWRIY